MSIRTSQYLFEKQIITKDTIAIHQYGIETLYASLINGVLVLLLSIAFNVFVPMFFFIIPFITIRSYAGGFHARTHLGCIIGFCVVYVAVVSFLKNIEITLVTQQTILALSVLLILLLGGIPHKNRPISQKQKIKFRKLTRIYGIFIFVVVFAGSYLFKFVFSFSVMGLFVSAVSLMVAAVQLKIQKED